MRVGIPRALLYYRYGNFWVSYFKALGITPVVSPKTDKKILESGLGSVSSEVCLPIKIIAGHIDLLDNLVDYIFLPRVVWLYSKLYTCPKMIGIVDIARMRLKKAKLLAPKIKNRFLLPHFLLGLKLTKNPIGTYLALKKTKNLLSKPNSLPEFPKDRKKIAIISHFYNLKEDFISSDILDTFKSNNFLVYTKEDLPQSVLLSDKGFADKIRWVYERELYNAFLFYLNHVDGILNIISFGCGPDSLIGEIMLKEAKKHSAPFLQLIIDEHTGKAGILTRLEAFIEMVKRRGAFSAEYQWNHKIPQIYADSP